MRYSIRQKNKSIGNETWYGMVRDKGEEPYEISLHTKSKKDAEDWLRDREDEQRLLIRTSDRGEAPRFELFCRKNANKSSSGTGISIRKACDLFIESKRECRDAKTITSYTSKLNHFCEFCNTERIVRIKDFKAPLAIKLANSITSTKSSKYAYEEIRLYKSFFSWCMDVYEIEMRNPFAKVERPHIKSKEKSIWSYEEITKILENAPNDEWRLLWGIMAFAGLRIAEATSLTWEDYYKGNKIHIEHGKGDKTADVPINDQLQPLFDVFTKTSRDQTGKIFKNIPKGNTSQLRVLRNSLEKAGLSTDDGNNHRFRHSFASKLIAVGVDIKSVQTLVRHARSQTTLDTYAHVLNFEALQTASNRLYTPSPNNF